MQRFAEAPPLHVFSFSECMSIPTHTLTPHGPAFLAPRAFPPTTSIESEDHPAIVHPQPALDRGHCVVPAITPLGQAVSVQEVHGIRDAMPWTPSHVVCYDSASPIEPLRCTGIRADGPRTTRHGP